MHPEASSFEASIAKRFALICEALDGLTTTQLDWRLDLPEANSAWVLAVHALGNARAWTLGIACGQSMGRDRPGEFASARGDAARFRDEVAAFATEMHVALEQLDGEALDRRLVPSKELWGEHEPRQISVREALLQVVEHASLHLGHLQVTAQLARART